MLWLLLLGSAVMPAFTYLYYFTHPGCSYTFLSLYRQGMFSLGAMVLLPICLGVLAAILVDSERSTRVLWQLWIVPVSAGGYILAKLAVLFAFSVAYFVSAAVVCLAPVFFLPALRPSPGALAFVVFHMRKQERVYIFDRNHIVDIAFLYAERGLCVGYLRGTGGDENDPDFLRFQTCLFHGACPCNLRSRLHRGFYGEKPGDKGGKLYPDQPDDGRTGRTDKGSLFRMGPDIFPGGLRYKFRGSTHFVYIVKSEPEERIEHNVHICQIIILCIERGGGESHCVSEIVDDGKRVIDRDLCVMRAVRYASAAVDAEFVYDVSFSVMYPDCLGRTVFDTVDAAAAGRFLQSDRTYEFIRIH